MADAVVRGGTLVTEGLPQADIAIEDGRIADIGPDLPGAPEEIDGRGLHVFPGLIDVHVHFNEPGRTEWEGAATGSRALAAGGGTLFFDMPLNSTPCTVSAAAIDRKLAALAESSITDFALWGGLIPGAIPRMAEMAEQGVVGFKAFMCNSGLPEFPRADDLTLFEGLREAARLGLPVAVHAESQELTAGLAQRVTGSNVRDFLASRPVVAELEAIGLFERNGEHPCVAKTDHLRTNALSRRGEDLAEAADGCSRPPGLDQQPHQFGDDAAPAQDLDAIEVADVGVQVNMFVEGVHDVSLSAKPRSISRNWLSTEASSSPSEVSKMASPQFSEGSPSTSRAGARPIDSRYL